MKANDKAVLAWMLVFAAFVLGSSTMLFILYHEFMHIVAYGMMGIEAHLSSPTTIDAARPHAWGLWAAYPMEIMSWAILGWFIAKAKHWWIAGFPLGFALGRVLYAVGSHDYNRIALQYGPEVPGTFKGLFVMFVLPLFAIVAYLAFRRARERYGEDRAYDTVQEMRKDAGFHKHVATRNTGARGRREEDRPATPPRSDPAALHRAHGRTGEKRR